MPAGYGVYILRICVFGEKKTYNECQKKVEKHTEVFDVSKYGKAET